MKAIVYKNRCTGCGLCAYTSPDLFKIEDYVAKVLKNPVPFKDYISCKDAAEQCPAEAIKIEE